MKQSEIKDLSAAELQEKLSLTKKTYADLKWLMLITTENPLQIRRRTIARLATELTKESCNHCNLPKDGRKRNLRKERVGVVTSDKMDKSIVVAEVRKEKKHPYGKFVLKTKKYVAHDETNDCNIGDTVRISETRPLSKSKCWRVEILERAK
jgi:small subunit ribosomal protein S17